MAQLTIRTHDGSNHTIKGFRDDEQPIRLPPEGFATFKGTNQELTIHVKTIATITRTKGTP